VIPATPRLATALLWLVRHVPDRALLEPLNRRLERRWLALSSQAGASPALAPRVDREAVHWIAADHYYDTSRLLGIGWRARYPVSTPAVVDTIRTLLAGGLLPGTGARALPAW
jgi:hypothetical protein